MEAWRVRDRAPRSDGALKLPSALTTIWISPLFPLLHEALAGMNRA
jgi:hypothetical protein